MKKNRIVIPSVDEIIEINKELKESFSVKRGILDFIVSKVKSRRPSKGLKRDIAKGAATLWQDIIENHPFLDGNKRTATEATLIFIEVNNFKLESPPNGLIYISLKLANRDISYNELIEWIYQKLKSKKK